MIDGQAIAHLISNTRFRFHSEQDLQLGIEHLLRTKEISFRREVRLTDKDRVDFLVDGGIGIEVKCDGGAMALARQVARYASSDQVTELVIVVSKSRLSDLPETLNEKRIHVVYLIASCF